ncbi:MAG: trimeric intracellular cation channel family protein [Thermoleophilaceae bacterium]
MAQIDVPSGFYVVDLLGVAAGAASGALVARRTEDFDVAGVVGLAFATGLGGGLLRDVLLQAGTPAALTNRFYIPLVVLVALGIALLDREPGPRLLGPIRVLDAMAIGFFAVAGALRAHDVGVTVPAQLLIGVLGGSGGALLRDVLTAKPPEIFRRGELNAIAALIAAGVFLALTALEATRSVAIAGGIIVGLGVRLAALRWDIRAPAPRRTP